jgi:hypothetical protein
VDFGLEIDGGAFWITHDNNLTLKRFNVKTSQKTIRVQRTEPAAGEGPLERGVRSYDHHSID